MTRARLYWICQLLGWAVALGGFMGLAALTGGFIGPRATPAQIAFAVVLAYTMSVGGSHAVHTVAVRRGWLELPLWSLAPRLGLAVAVAAVLAQGAGSVLSHLAEPVVNPASDYPLPPPEPVDFIGSALMLTAIYAVWATVYALAVTAFRLADAERDRFRLRASLAESRMRALEYQLNPHFLFNALNTVRALVADEPEEARRAVTLLSSLLRQTLAAGREAVHPLSTELDLVRTYLALESIRFDDRLRVHIEADDAVLDVSVPALLVQTLVENAVKHGVAQRREGGEVVVQAHRDGGTLVLRVENPTAEGPGAEGTGTGLVNARERLALLYGDRAQFDLTLADDRALATVHLPASWAPVPLPDAPHA